MALDELFNAICPARFESVGDKRKLVVFLPAVTNKAIFPYFPRISWRLDLVEDADVLYLADPYQQLPEYKESMGSWFISPEGKSLLPSIVEAFNSNEVQDKYENIVFYGSSMGGYASIMLGLQVGKSKSIAECPQINLDKHPGSAYVLSQMMPDNVDELLPFKYIKNSKKFDITIVCSVFDLHHQRKHLIRFQDFLSNEERVLGSFKFVNYLNPNYK